jgi:5-methylcytosine-specific restriction endonuclease McrA
VKTLLLNCSYEPIRLISWQEAISDQWLGKIDVLATYEAVVRSCYLEIQIPAVARLKRRHRYRSEVVPFERRFVYARDHWRCCYCGERFPDESLTFDHVVPKSKGGKTSWTNIVTACTVCNGRKDDRTPEEAGMPLRTKPIQPRWMPSALVDSVGRGPVPPQWADWVDWLAA